MVRFASISGSFGLAMGILARLRLAKIRTMARPNSPDMIPKRTKKVRLGIISSRGYGGSFFPWNVGGDRLPNKVCFRPVVNAILIPYFIPSLRKIFSSFLAKKAKIYPANPSKRSEIGSYSEWFRSHLYRF